MSPTVFRRCSALTTSGVFLFLTLPFLGACQDPSGVGLDVLGEEGTDPAVSVVAADMVTTEEENEFTGGFARSITPTQTRVLVGAAIDPMLGDVSAFAYADIIAPETVPDGYFERPIIAATLRLVRNYVYGDSTVSVPLQLYQMDASWLPIGAPSDTTFDAGALLLETTVLAEDSVVALGLPASWISQYDEILQSDTVASAIDGFQIRLPDGVVPGAVMGFDTALSTLEVRTAQDTVDYPLFEVFSHIDRDDAAPPPTDRIVLRSGAGEALALTFPFVDFDNLPLANATLRLTVDPALLNEPGFARPIPASLSLFGRTESGDRLAILDASLNEASNSYSFTSATLTALVQEALIGDAIVDRFELSVTSSTASVDALPLIIGPEPLAGETDSRPRFALTVIPRPS